MIAHIVLLQPRAGSHGGRAPRRARHAGARRGRRPGDPQLPARPPRQARAAGIRTDDDAGLRVRADHRSRRRAGADAISDRRRRTARWGISSRPRPRRRSPTTTRWPDVDAEVRRPRSPSDRGQAGGKELRDDLAELRDRLGGVDGHAQVRSVVESLGVPRVQRAQLVDDPAVVASRAGFRRRPGSARPGAT